MRFRRSLMLTGAAALALGMAPEARQFELGPPRYRIKRSRRYALPEGDGHDAERMARAAAKRARRAERRES